MPQKPNGSSENGNWSSFQLANSTPPLSVTGSAIAPSARMFQLPLGSPDGGILARTHGISTHYPRECAWVAFHMCITAVQDPAPGAHTVCNLPGWRWATIMQVVLDRLSRSLHSDVCDSDGCRDAVAHSRISGRGTRRSRAVPNYSTINGSLKPSVLLVLQSRVACWPVAQAHALMYPIARRGHQRASTTHGMQATPT